MKVMQVVRCVGCGAVARFESVRDMLNAAPLLIFGGTAADGGKVSRTGTRSAVMRDGMCAACMEPFFAERGQAGQVGPVSSEGGGRDVRGSNLAGGPGGGQ